ncbi:MAG TPA: response regulator [bacterium]|nr:response regulator [bacterium]HOL48157.1 response regulator [bacterium]HPQ17758.1 response regulator [bacterium]
MAEILVVDDSELTQNYHSYILKSEGHNVDIASDGVEAIDKISNKKYDLMLVDINMPNLDGLSLIRKIRSASSGEIMPIIIISTDDNPHDEEILNLEKVVFIMKPVEPEFLTANIKMLLDS